MSGTKKHSKKTIWHSVWKGTGWNVVAGRLVAAPGRPDKVKPLFEVVAEKLPYDCLADVKKDMEKYGFSTNGIYLAHDSMGVARYGGRGQIFTRLRTHKKRYPRELVYFSFYTVAAKAHEREIETVILRAAGPQLVLNNRKVSSGIRPGLVGDYEPRTEFFERQKARGRKKKKGK